MQKNLKILDIAKALLEKDFVFYYQPIVSLVTGRICGAEALVRWKAKDGKVIPPSGFIPIAEETDLITEFTLEAISAVFRDLPKIDKVDNSIWVSFNTSAKDFADNRVLDHISQNLKNFNLPPNRLHLEITETAFLPLEPRTKQAIYDIHDLGLEIALNDFSTGHSTLDYLSSLPFSILKIAMPIARRMATSSIDWKLFRHLVGLGHQLNYTVIAEGIENNELHGLTLATGCSSAQGFFYSQPLPFDDFISLLRENRKWVDFPYGLMYLAQIDHLDYERDFVREAINIYNNSDHQLRQNARARVPSDRFSEDQFYEWYLNTKTIIPEIFNHSQDYENTFHQFQVLCNELLQLAEEQVAWDIFERKYKEIIDLTASASKSLISMSTESLILAHKKKV